MELYCIPVNFSVNSCSPLKSYGKKRTLDWVQELILVLAVSQPAGDVSHKRGGRLPSLSARPVVTLVILRRAAITFAAWWTETRWVWTVCLRLLPDSVVAAIWTQALHRLSSARLPSLSRRGPSTKNVYKIPAFFTPSPLQHSVPAVRYRHRPIYRSQYSRHTSKNHLFQSFSVLKV